MTALRAIRFVPSTRATTTTMPETEPACTTVETKPSEVLSFVCPSLASVEPSSEKITRMPFLAGRPSAFSTRNVTSDACGFDDPTGPIDASKSAEPLVPDVVPPGATNSITAAAPVGPPGLPLGFGVPVKFSAPCPPHLDAKSAIVSSSAPARQPNDIVDSPALRIQSETTIVSRTPRSRRKRAASLTASSCVGYAPTRTR